MKILAINGSHRGDKGHTRFLLDKLSKGASDEGAEFEIVTLSRLDIKPCISCGTCNSKEHFLKCIYDEKDDARKVIDKMKEADLIIFATPIYFFTLSGMFTNFMDRLYSTSNPFEIKMTKSGLLFHHLDETIFSKPFVALICCDNIEKETPKNAISFFKTYGKFHDAEQVGLLVRNAGRFMGHGKDPDAEKRSPKIRDAYQAFEDAGRELAVHGRISPSTQKRACQDVLPMPRILNLLKNFRPVKRMMVEQAKKHSKHTEGAV